MTHWQQNNKTEQLQILDIVSEKTKLPRIAVEKDWWVTIVIKALSLTEYASLMSFKGGTSLSKGWRLIERFSEDIDIALKREGRFSITGTSNTQLAKVRRTARHYIVKELPQQLSKALISLGIKGFTVEPDISRLKDNHQVELRADTHPSAISVIYNSILPETSEYLQPRVKIEISCLSMDEPVEIKELQSFIADCLPNEEDVSVNFKTVVPTRTFLEKIFLLHEEFQKKQPRSLRMSRHLYDLTKIADTAFGAEALSNYQLYNEIVKHRSVFNRIPSMDYATYAPNLINIIPPDRVMEDWKKDYANMQNRFIYERNSLSFNELIDKIKVLQNRIRNS